jgi:ribosomal protein L37AE/L43A
MYSLRMSDTSKESPVQPGQSQNRSSPNIQDPLTWAAIGFAVGTLALAPLILSIDIRDKLLGGAMVGGSLGALIGLAYGAMRRRNVTQERSAAESVHAETCPMCGATTTANAARCLSCGEKLAGPTDRVTALNKTIPSSVGFALILLTIVLIAVISKFLR